MSILDKLQKGVNDRPPVGVIYGRPGIGKSTIAARMPAPLFIQTEPGLRGEDFAHIDTFGVLSSYDEIREAMGAVYQHSAAQGWKTVVIDTIDRLNPLIEKYVCDSNGWKSLEDGAYGKGKSAYREEWQKFLTGLLMLRDQCNVGVVMIGHCAALKVTPPDVDPYSQWTLTLDDKVRQFVVADADFVAFATYPTHVVSKDQGFGKKSTRAITEAPVLVMRESGAQLAKNRYNMPERIPLEWEALASYIPAWAETIPAKSNEEVA